MKDNVDLDELDAEVAREDAEREELIAKARLMPESAACPYPLERVRIHMLRMMVAGELPFSDVEDCELTHTDEQLARFKPIDPEKAKRLMGES